jgi:hypothetical protein
LGQTTTHIAPREEEDVKTNQMIRKNYGYNHWSQSHASLEGDGVADMCEACINNFFYLYKTKNS